MYKHVAGESVEKYVLNKIYPDEIETSHKSGDFHIHDLSMGNIGYCAGWSLQDLINEGFNGVKGRIASGPPKHFDTALLQMTNFLGTLQNEWAGAQAFNCYSEDTELLTKDGWKYFRDLEGNEEVFTLDKENKKTEFQSIDKQHEYNYNGTMYHFDTKFINLLVTPKHKMLLRQRKSKWNSETQQKEELDKENKPLIFQQCKNINFSKEGRCRHSVPRNFEPEKASVEDKEISVVDPKYKDKFMKFVGIYLAEGATNKGLAKNNEYRLTISQDKEAHPKIYARINKLLEGLPFSYSKDDGGFYIYGKKIYKWIENNIGTSAHNKKIPKSAKQQKPKHLKDLITWFRYGDGYKNKEGTEMLFTCSKALRDDLQECIFKIGGYANYFKWSEKGDSNEWNNGRTIEQKHDLWCVTVHNEDKDLTLFKPKKEEYEGKVYDITVPNHTLLVRRNGKVIWSSNSMDTLLAPFVGEDNLDYKEIKQGIQKFIFNLNVTSRWGGQCVSDDTEALTCEGWKTHDEIKDTDKIATFNTESGEVEFLEQNIPIFSYEYDDEMVHLENRITDQLVTPDHRVVRKKFNSNEYTINEAQELEEFSTSPLLPLAGETDSDKEISDNEVKLYAWLISEGSFSDGERDRVYIWQSVKSEYNERIEQILDKLDISYSRNLEESGYSDTKCYRYRINTEDSREIRKTLNSKQIPEIIFNISKRQIRLFLDEYIKGDGHVDEKGRIRIYTSDMQVKDDIQELCAISGYGTTVHKRDNGNFSINLIRNPIASVTSMEREEYEGIVWCPNTDNGTFIARRNGKVFVTGNTPFTNLTMDWTVPDDLKDKNAIIGGEILSSAYGDYEQEIEEINKAFLEVLSEGDANDRPFSVVGETEVPIYEENKIKNKTIKELFNYADGQGNVRRLDKTIFSVNNKKCNPTNAKQIIRHKHKGKIFKIKTDRNKVIKTSPSHSLFTVNEHQDIEPVEAKNLEKGDVIITVNNLNWSVSNKSEEKKIKYNEYTKKWEKGKRGCSIDVSEEEKELTNNLSWLYGYFVGDGYWTENSISFAPASKEEAEEIISRMKKEFDIEPSYVRDDYFEVIYKRKFISSIFSHAIGRNTSDKIIPLFIWNGSGDIKQNFWDGLFKADGTKGTGIFKQADDKFLKSLRLFLMSIGKTSSINLGQEKETNYLISGEDNRISNQYWNYVKTHRIDSGKYQRYKKAHPEGIEEFANSDLSVNKVKNIEMIEFDSFLYDIVANGNFLCSNGILLHNTFPIPTYNVDESFPLHGEKGDLLFEVTAKYGLPYFSNFLGNTEMDSSDIRSMCPLHGDEKVLIKSDRYNGVEFSNIGNLSEREYEVFSNGKFVEGEFNNHGKQETVKVELANGHEIKMSKKHLNFVKESKNGETEELEANQLESGMYLPYSLNDYEGDDRGDYELGYFIGAFAGDGSRDKSRIVFSLNKEEKEIARKLSNIAREKFGANITKSINDEVLSLYVNSKGALGTVNDFVKGKKRNKHYTFKAIETSKEFRKGLLDGHLDTDGGNRNRIYTSSEKMVETLNMITSTLGTTTSIFKDDREDERFSNNTNFAVLIYQLNRESYSDIWFKEDDKLWIKIDEINDFGRSEVYCFEVTDDEPMFTVANTGILTHNCRLRLDERELERNVTGGLFGSSDKTGSLGVISMNMPRIAFKSDGRTDFFNRLEKLMDRARDSLEIKRDIVNKNMENGLLPYSKRYLGSLDNHFSTIGLVGFNEASYHLLNGKGIVTSEGRELAVDTLKFMREKLQDFQEKTGNLYNLEASPAEGTSYRLARKDREFYPEMFNDIPKYMENLTGSDSYYTNSTQLPVYETGNIFRALEHQEDIQDLYTGGTVFHAFLGERMSKEGAKTFVRKTLKNSKIPYLTVTPTYSICPSCGYKAGEHYECPDCNSNCEVYSRVVGYMRPVSSWNDGKQKEFNLRKTFDVEG